MTTLCPYTDNTDRYLYLPRPVRWSTPNPVQSPNIRKSNREPLLGFMIGFISGYIGDLEVDLLQYADVRLSIATNRCTLGISLVALILTE